MLSMEVLHYFFFVLFYLYHLRYFAARCLHVARHMLCKRVLLCLVERCVEAGREGMSIPVPCRGSGFHDMDLNFAFNTSHLVVYGHSLRIEFESHRRKKKERKRGACLPAFMSTLSTLPYFLKRRSRSPSRASYSKFPQKTGFMIPAPVTM